MEDWALIRRLAAEGIPKTQIADVVGIVHPADRIVALRVEGWVGVAGGVIG